MTTKDPKRVSIRLAVPSDVEDLVAMRLRIEDHMVEGNPDIWRMSAKKQRAKKGDYLTDLANDQKRVLVALDGAGAPIAMAVGSIRRHEETAPALSGRIDDVWVAPKHREAGVASALIQELLEFYKERGVEDLVLVYAAGNREAEAVWETLGFRPIFISASAKLADVERKVQPR
ncbi:MAG: GNAT family N-acetyltransferase [Pseudomonadota bacterium]